MFKHILIPIALHHQTDAEEDIALARRLLAEDGMITLLGVIEQVSGYVAEYVTVKPDANIREAVRAQLAAVTGDADDIEVAVQQGKPGLTIAEYAASAGVDLIVIRSHRPGAADIFLGSTAARVVRRAPCAVMVLR